MPADLTPLKPVMRHLGWPLRLTWAGLLAERVVRAFWPLWTLLITGAALVLLGLQDDLPVIWLRVLAGLAGVLVLVALGYGLRVFRWPGRKAALARLDAIMPGQPLAALRDAQAIGAGDAGSEALWRAHQARMAQRVRGVRRVAPDLKLAARDVFGLRYVALTGLVVALLFGAFARVGSVTQMLPGQPQMASGPMWEGWIEPPAYTGLPGLYLADQAGELRVPEGSVVTLRLYGDPGDVTVTQSIGSGGAEGAAHEYTVKKSGALAIDGPGGRAWQIGMIGDRPPQVAWRDADKPVKGAEGQMNLPFRAQDDYGVTGGTAVITLDMAALDRRHGLAAAPEPRDAITLDLPLPISGDRSDFTEALRDNLSQHPWAHLPVKLRLTALDATGQTGESPAKTMPLPARRFFDPLAAALVEQRRDLLWTRENARRVAQVIRAVSYRPEPGLFPDSGAYLQMRAILRRLEAEMQGGLSVQARDDLAAALWALALQIEDGDITDALERMRTARERLSQAMRNGASAEEIARLMQELREATENYLQKRFAESEYENGADAPDGGETIEITEQDLQDMMDRIEELMTQGRHAEAEEALRQFQEMMENMRMARGQGGGFSIPGEGGEGLAETLREQQDLSDEAFRDLQDQFNGGQGNEGQPGPDGQPGADGRGDDLSERQEDLRRRLEEQRGAPGPSDAETGEALDRAERAMRGAEKALRDGDLPGALDRQAEAMEALRDGIRGMKRDQAGGDGQSDGNRANATDPLGRETGQGAQAEARNGAVRGNDMRKRAQELLDEIRRRSGEGARPEEERDYLKRLLELF